MKKLIFVSFILFTALSVLTTQAAYDATATETTNNVASSPAQNKLFIQWNDAIYKRMFKLYMNQTVRTNEWKNLYNREERLVDKQKDASVDSGTAKLNRDGALNPVDYSGSYNNPAYAGVSAKQNWRRCAINYYVEGGNCSTEDMNQDLIYASTYKVETVPSIFWKQDVAVINDVRAVQRLLESSEQIGAGQQVQRAETKSTSAGAVGGSPFQKMPTFGE